MYEPVKDGLEKHVRAVSYTEVEPPAHLREVAHCFWEIRSERTLADDLELHAMPDACVNILFDQLDPRIAGVTLLHTSHITLNLCRRFHYVGVQLFPGAWRGDLAEAVDHYVGEPYSGDLPLLDTNRRLVDVSFEAKTMVLAELVDALAADGVIEADPTVARILTSIAEIHSVTDMAEAAALSPRQLQRNLKASTGFTPHDLLKILRLQHAIRHDDRLGYTDQSHFIRSFRAVTGYPPGRFSQTFDV